MDKVIMPKELTAENGAEGLLSGEFSETSMEECDLCDDGLFFGSECDHCCGTGQLFSDTPISWDTIKDIYAMAVKHLSEPIDNG